MLITPDNVLIVQSGLDSRFQKGFTTAPVWSPAIYDEAPSSGPFNTYEWMDEIPRMREWLGERVVHGLKGRTFPIYNKTYELTVAVKREQIEDNDLAGPQRIAGMAGTQSAKLPDDLMTALLQGGHAAACFDGQFFFDTDHPTNIDNGSGSQQNYWSSGMALTAANIFSVWSTMTQYKGANGKVMGIMPNKLLIPPQLKKAALEIVADTLSTGGANVLKGFVEIIVAPELGTEPTAWYLIDDTKGIRPFIYQKRREVALQAKMSLTDDSVFHRNEFQWGVDTRVGAGYGCWFLCSKAVA